VWRLGVLLLDAEGRLRATGRVIRAEHAVRKSVTAESVAEQRAYRAAAVKGGIPDGATVVFDAAPIELDGDALGAGATSGPVVLVVDDGGAARLAVRWNPAIDGALMPFDAYLSERVDLLAHPPQGA
jgi:hypothetical protein